MLGSSLSPHRNLTLHENLEGYGTPAAVFLRDGQDGMAIDWRRKHMLVRTTQYNSAGTTRRTIQGDPQDILTYSAPSVKMLFDEDGILAERTAGNIPYAYYPITGRTCHGCFGESASTEKITRSWDLDHADWTANNLGGGALGTGDTSPMGSGAAAGKTTYYRMDTDGVSGNHSIEIGLTLTANTYVHLFCFVKPQELGTISLGIYGTANNYAVCTFNLSAGTFNTSYGGASGDTYSNNLTDIFEFKSGEYMVYFNCRVNEANPTFICQLTDSATPTYDTQGKVSFAGTSGDGVDVFIMNAQTEDNRFCTPILTDGSEVTRAADAITLSRNVGCDNDRADHYRRRYGDTWAFCIPWHLHMLGPTNLTFDNSQHIIGDVATDARGWLRSRNNNGSSAYAWDAPGSGYSFKTKDYAIDNLKGKHAFALGIGPEEPSGLSNSNHNLQAKTSGFVNWTSGTANKSSNINRSHYDDGRDDNIPVVSQLGPDTGFVYFQGGTFNHGDGHSAGFGLDGNTVETLVKLLKMQSYD